MDRPQAECADHAKVCVAQIVQVVRPIHLTRAHPASAGSDQPTDVTEVVRTVQANATVAHTGPRQIDGGDPLVKRELAHGIQCDGGRFGGG